MAGTAAVQAFIQRVFRPFVMTRPWCHTTIFLESFAASRNISSFSFEFIHFVSSRPRNIFNIILKEDNPTGRACSAANCKPAFWVRNVKFILMIRSRSRILVQCDVPIVGMSDIFPSNSHRCSLSFFNVLVETALDPVLRWGWYDASPGPIISWSLSDDPSILLFLNLYIIAEWCATLTTVLPANSLFEARLLPKRKLLLASGVV